ncbi:hypothetical protein Syun_020541 [Stephania yunnanensis]|uniref:Protein argonaute N-terminal domain-containing protein n=1 Tax=Stephania yunnanensis TaxID=152371 RepID=A0AAP0IDZ0_9MAGN
MGTKISLPKISLPHRSLSLSQRNLSPHPHRSLTQRNLSVTAAPLTVTALSSLFHRHRSLLSLSPSPLSLSLTVAALCSLSLSRSSLLSFSHPLSHRSLLSLSLSEISPLSLTEISLPNPKSLPDEAVGSAGGGDGDGIFSSHIGQAGGRGGCSPYGGRGGGGGDGGRGGGGGNYPSYGGRGGGDGGRGCGNYSSYGGRGGRDNYSYGGRAGGGGRGYGGDGGGCGRGRGRSWQSDLHQASFSSDVERKLEQLSLKPEEQLIRFSSRPPPGIIGEKSLVKTNHFQVEIDSSLKEFFHYNVSITPEVLFSKDYLVIMEELRNLYLETDMNGEPLAYDGRKSFYTRNRLPVLVVADSCRSISGKMDEPSVGKCKIGEVEGSTHVGVKLLVSYQKEIVADSSGYSLYVLLTEVVVCSSNNNCCSCSLMNIIS